ncbi:hypothetical protein ACIQXW_06365 [Lysinibacillus sp. NPDC097162]|uniref:hypothetical protein n=1 Tax=Lysinibacillus sp. NPDC097162 TaxID=3364140 RepID=UPI00382D7604
MISIKNIKTLEDLKEERINLINQLEHLKLLKSEQLYEMTVKLMRSIQEYLKPYGLDVYESNNQSSKGFVANYKNGYLRGEVAVNSNILNIIFNANVIETIEVLPKPTHTFYMQGISVEEDIFSSEILNLDAEIKEIKDEIKAYEKLDVVYVVKSEETDTTLLNEVDVQKYLFK